MEEKKENCCEKHDSSKAHNCLLEFATGNKTCCGMCPEALGADLARRTLDRTLLLELDHLMQAAADSSMHQVGVVQYRGRHRR